MSAAFEKYLEEVGDTKRPLVTTRLTRLARLSSSEKIELAAYWPKIDPARKERIAKLLSELGEDNVELDFEDIFRLCLDDRSPAVREAGIDGLWECTDRWFLDRLIVLVREDESAEVRAAAASALGQFTMLAAMGDLRSRDAARIEEALLAVLADESENVNVRRRALESLGAIRNEPVAAAIEKAHASDQPELRVGAVYAMGKSCDERWLPTILQDLQSPDTEMRYEAVNACGEMEEQKAVPYLIPLLRDSDAQIRISVVTTLGHIGGPRAKQELTACLRHPDEQVKEAAQEALEELTFYGDPLTFGFGSGSSS